MFMGCRLSNRRESIGQNKCHDQIVRTECEGTNEIVECNKPAGQIQGGKPVGEQNWDTDKEIRDESVHRTLKKYL
jgi:hypothetical protein